MAPYHPLIVCLNISSEKYNESENYDEIILNDNNNTTTNNNTYNSIRYIIIFLSEK